MRLRGEEGGGGDAQGCAGGRGCSRGGGVQGEGGRVTWCGQLHVQMKRSSQQQVLRASAVPTQHIHAVEHAEARLGRILGLHILLAQLKIEKKTYIDRP